jgi:hypothetical protein
MTKTLECYKLGHAIGAAQKSVTLALQYEITNQIMASYNAVIALAPHVIQTAPSICGLPKTASDELRGAFRQITNSNPQILLEVKHGLNTWLDVMKRNQRAL